jgi:hypothetical protein
VRVAAAGRLSWLGSAPRHRRFEDVSP